MTANETLRTWDMQFSKEELRRALPRRNFFSCHSQALKDAGYEVENDSPRRRRRLFFFNHEEEDEIAKVSASNQKQAPPIIKEPPGAGEGKENGTGVADHDKENVNGQDKTSDDLVETAVSLLTFAEKAKRRRSSVMPHQPQVVECRPLMQYLTYVRDNPTEYRQMIAKTHSPGSSHHHANTAAASDPATIHLLQMGRAFQARHAGGERADDVIRAAYALRPRSADPNRFAKLTREKSPLVPGLMSKRESTVAALGGGGMGGGGGVGQRGSKPGSEDHRHRQEAAPAEHMTEMEKRRQRAEEWTKSVTTDQLVRAKLHVLKELGHEEHELSKWWLAFRDCFYIRPKHR
nr:hypothetical protein BaRGS_006952 [Batillaria attramentaria]